MKQLFLAEGKFLGEAVARSIFVHSEITHQLSSAYLCRHCGEVYATRPVILESGSPAQWRAIHGCCRKCVPTPGEIPGSIHRAWEAERDPLDVWPDPALKWEFLRRLEYWERYGTEFVGIN